MSRFIRFIRIAWKMSGQLPWVDEPKWTSSDANELRKFLVTVEGKRFRMIMLNMVLKQNQQAVSSNKELEFNAAESARRRLGLKTAGHLVIFEKR